MGLVNINIFSRIKNYRKLSAEIQEVLLKNPADSPKFQEIFNLTVDRIYQDILEFERQNITNFESDVYKLRRVFEKRYRQYFLYGEYVNWVAKKPFGYAGDFKIIDDIYKNQVQSVGFDSLWDNWFQQLTASKAVRERKDDFKKIIFDFVKERKNQDIRIMNLASGPAREIKELLEEDKDNLFSRVTFDCYDFDIRALNYARELLNQPQSVNFFQKNAVRMALKKDITTEIPYKYDLIYSTGLFDYFDENIATRLVGNLKRIVKDEGVIFISNFRDKYSNPSSIWMEWIGEWYLIYRTEEDFSKIFLNAGFLPRQIKIIIQDSKVMQYCFVKK